MKILCIHGIGGQEASKSTWQPKWTQAVQQSLLTFSTPGTPAPDIDFLPYDEFFVQPLAKLGYVDFIEALGKLLGNWFTQPRGMFDLSEGTRWYAGMVVAWVNDSQLREKLRRRLILTMQAESYDIVVAHSLGSLVAYDTFSQAPEELQDKTLITLGSQIGNSFLAGAVFAGHLAPIATAKHWYHLYNPNDRVFTAPLNVGRFQNADNFSQVVTKFGDDLGFTNFLSAFTSDIAANHTAVIDDPNKCYLKHPQAMQQVWMPIANSKMVAELTSSKAFTKAAVVKRTPTKRALLVGINEYQDSKNNLQGCLNDVFLMSSLLQESGFDSEDIRVVFNDRATADGIRERLRWLLGGVDDGDTRFLFYSGHGAQLPTYGTDGQIDHVQSCIVPHNFNWSVETSITDEDMVQLYSQLSYKAHFMMVLDCCYSGGLTRGSDRARGLEPPDDIRHRMLKWNADEQMWEVRKLDPLNNTLSQEDSKRFQGSNRATSRIGRAMSMRTMSNKEYDTVRNEQKSLGPYAPIVYEACGENELSYEYLHGATSYGAFTFAMGQVLRATSKPITFQWLLEETKKKLNRLKYPQTPELFGPTSVAKANIPWQGVKKSKK